MCPDNQVAGVGVDIVDVKRLGAAVRRCEAFLRRNFSEGELSYCLPLAACHHHLAARFAAKEAVCKALGAGVALSEVEVVKESNGAPRVRLSGRALSEHSDKRLLLSLSHDGDYAVAFCIALAR